MYVVKLALDAPDIFFMNFLYCTSDGLYLK